MRRKTSSFSQIFLLLAAFKKFFCRVYCCSVGLLLIWSRDDIQRNEVANSTARNFNNSWPLYLCFSNMIKLYPNIWFIKNSKCHQFLFWEEAPKNTNFSFFKRAVISQWVNLLICCRILRDFGGLFKLFPNYRQCYVNLNVKSNQKLLFIRGKTGN